MVLVAPSADAATTIGQLFAPTASTTATLAQTGVQSGVGYTVPADGVITSWAFLADSDGAKIRLTVVRAVGNGQYTVVGESDQVTAAPGQQQSFATRIPVKAGDYLGTVAAAGKSIAFTGAQGDAVLLTPGDQPAGSTGSYSNVSQIRIDATASVEPDADGDGFGDETQDSCPTDPSLQSRCTSNLSMTVTADKRSVIPGSDVTFGLTVHNSGPSTSNGVQIVAELSPELTLEGTAGGNCSGGSRLTCAVADIPKDGDAVVRVVAKATTIGPASMAAKATSSTTDSDQSDNGGGITVAVVWRSGRCANTFTARAGRDVFRGTSAGDLVNGLTGNDILSGLGGADCLSGGPGNDRITGGDGNDRLSGGDGNDTIGGDAGNDSIDGGAGNDQLAGGSGADTISAGSGNDGVNAADGVRDLVDCGAGRDTVRADRRDRLKRCEKVVWVKIAPPRRHAKR